VRSHRRQRDGLDQRRLHLRPQRPRADDRRPSEADVCASGVAITTTAFDWEGLSNPDFTAFTPGVNLSGTSTVGPLVAGAISLLQDYGAAAYPAGLKALILTAPHNSVLTSAGASTSHTAPDGNIGYGVLDCGAAYTYRGSVYEGQLTSSGPRYVLLRGGSLASGGRATLVWSRHVTSAGSGIPTTYYSIQDLDFYAYDESSGSQLGASASAVDPNEQLASVRPSRLRSSRSIARPPRSRPTTQRSRSRSPPSRRVPPRSSARRR